MSGKSSQPRDATAHDTITPTEPLQLSPAQLRQIALRMHTTLTMAMDHMVVASQNSAPGGHVQTAKSAAKGGAGGLRASRSTVA